jgi:hypothetical protein
VNHIEGKDKGSNIVPKDRYGNLRLIQGNSDVFEKKTPFPNASISMQMIGIGFCEAGRMGHDPHGAFWNYSNNFRVLEIDRKSNF